MITIKHRFRDFKNKENIEMLILGTFNPESVDEEEKKIEIFYGRTRNHLWDLLPKAVNQPGLKDKPVDVQLKFIENYKIGFVDIIKEIKVDIGQEKNYSDNYIDDKVVKWTDIEEIIHQYPKIKKVYFTRKTFNGIPNIKKQIDIIKAACSSNNIKFFCLPTPARFINNKKLIEWKNNFQL
ncbi:MAG TPA: hypothetical protein PKX62_15065 [Spirochaetota bacterium]|nr:hypothetical protein [Spirochaetota bacterium]